MHRSSLVFLLLLSSAFPAMAHNTWFAPQPPNAAHNYWLLLLSTGSEFPQRSQAPQERHIARAELVSSRKSVVLFPLKSMPDALPFRVISDDDPLQVAIATLKPSVVELDADAVEIYLRDELASDAGFRKRYTSQQRWRERFTKNAKALLRMRGDASAPIALKPHGLAYELVPSVDPTLVPAGTSFEVCAYANDQRVPRTDAHIAIGLVEADGRMSTQAGDADGCATVAPSADGYLLHSILLRPVDEDDVDWESHFAALTVARAAAPALP